jgi:hypothetical protein
MARSGEMRCETAGLVSRLAIPFPCVARARRPSRCFRGRLQQPSARKWAIAFAATARPVLAGDAGALLSASIGAFDPGTFIRETGAAQVTKRVGVMANDRF